MKVNVYDFDKTILPYDSSLAFFRFCAGRYPRAAVLALPGILRAPLIPLGLSSKTKAKEWWYRYLTMIPDVETEVALFWEKNFKNINRWYLERRRPDDIIISASPEFLLKLPAEKLGVRLIASRVDRYTGAYEGSNNDGAEKVRRLFLEYPDAKIGEFFSDSNNDTPLALLAEKAWMVEGDILKPWPKK
ncbi:MAG: phosphoserine phosphatase [Clostridia bacterium]|nr:phosphoserine phosphatase [Clostridia bacterium]